MKRSRKFSLTAWRAGPGRPRRHVQRRDRETAGEIHPDEASLGIHVFHPEPAHDTRRRFLRVDRDPAIAFLLRVHEGAVVGGEVERLGRQLMLLRLRLLQAHHVGGLCVHPAEEALARGGADAVEVAGDDAEHDLED